MLVGLLAGCVSNQPRESGGRTESYAIRENVKLGEDLQDDFERALQLLRSEQYEEGIALLKAITQHPEGQRNTAPYINLAIAYQRLEKLEQAEESVKQALGINPEHPAANNEYGMVLRKTGRFQEARAVYERLLGKYPEYLPARKNLGILCDLFIADLDCALEHYRIYSAAVPDDPTVTIWIADVQNRRGQ